MVRARKRITMKRGRKPRMTRGYSKPSRLLGSVYSAPVLLKRSLKLDGFAVGAAFVGKGYSFRLNQVPNHTDITNLFDYYKFMGVRLKFIFANNTALTGGNTNLPNLLWTPDYDDANIPGSEDVLLERNTTKMARLDKVIKVYLKPKINNEIYNNGVTSGYALNKGSNPYIDSVNDAVNHFGLKCGIVLNGNQDATGYLKVYATYYFKCLHSQ